MTKTAVAENGKPSSSAAAASDPVQALRLSAGLLLALALGQVGMHATMAGLRFATTLQALQEGRSAWAVGVLLALYGTAPVLLAFPLGRYIDRHGYHGPVRLALACTFLGGLAVLSSTWVTGAIQYGLWCLGALLAGAGTNVGMMTITRAAGLLAQDSVERVRVFSWLGVAGPLSNVIGPVMVGFLIDGAGFRAAYLFLLALPLLTLFTMRKVPQVATSQADASSEVKPAWGLFMAPGMRRLLLMNGLLSMCWDVHLFAVPILGHERGFSASTLGLIMGSFTVTVTLVRGFIPFIAAHLKEATVLRAAMLVAATSLASYPWAYTPWMMAVCSMALGVAMGSVQPMLLSMLHQITPDDRHGESLALRSLVSHSSSSLMPLVFGASGTLIGASMLFWLVGGSVGAGSWLAAGLRAPPAEPSARL